MKLEHDAILRLKDQRHEKTKKQMISLQEAMAEEKTKWQAKLDNITTQLESANDSLYLEKRKRWDAVAEQVRKAELKQQELQDFIDELEDMNSSLAEECMEALADKKAALSQGERAKALAKRRLDKWHAERQARREAQDELARQSKILARTHEVLETYRVAAESSEDCKRRMKKEWQDETAKSKQGGGRMWPVWVVQLICELLVNGTPPTAIPGNIRIMYETLYGEEPDDEPSVNFVRECRPIVEVIGETITAMKLADAESWDQLWTDGTTRRQIPFAALVIGILGDNDVIDPVVISWCIFMKDERSETQADGVLSKVSTIIANDQRKCIQLT